jgi:transposase InsO family protein
MGPGVDAKGIPNTVYMIAFIDDATRYIMGYQLITNKTAETCAMALRMILHVRTPPYIIGSDNGGEFRRRALTSLLNEFQIRTWYGQPYTPQQNGKIERFWATMENTIERSRDPDVITNGLMQAFT